MSKLLDLMYKEAGELALVPGEGAKNADPLAYKLRKNVAPKVEKLLNSSAGKFVRGNGKAIAGASAAVGAGGALAAKLLSKKTMPEQALALAKKNPKVTAALAALGLTAGAAGVAKAASIQKTAAEEAYESIEMAKQAAEELAEESLQKLAFAEQLYNEANYVTESLEKDASEVEDVETDGSALEAFLEELEAE